VYDGSTIVNGVTLSNTNGRLAEAYTGTSASKITDLGFNYNARGEVVNYYEKTPTRLATTHFALLPGRMAESKA
jgi:hypothetical protein